jgi:hypothetical protein
LWQVPGRSSPRQHLRARTKCVARLRGPREAIGAPRNIRRKPPKSFQNARGVSTMHITESGPPATDAAEVTLRRTSPQQHPRSADATRPRRTRGARHNGNRNQRGSVVATPDEQIDLSTLISATPAANDPAYLIVSGLDRDDYTAGYNTSHMGSLSGGGTSQTFTNVESDAWSVVIVFTYQASTGTRYTAISIN